MLCVQSGQHKSVTVHGPLMKLDPVFSSSFHYCPQHRHRLAEWASSYCYSNSSLTDAEDATQEIVHRRQICFSLKLKDALKIKIGEYLHCLFSLHSLVFLCLPFRNPIQTLPKFTSNKQPAAWSDIRPMDDSSDCCWWKSPRKRKGILSPG